MRLYFGGDLLSLILAVRGWRLPLKAQRSFFLRIHFATFKVLNIKLLLVSFRLSWEIASVHGYTEFCFGSDKFVSFHCLESGVKNDVPGECFTRTKRP